MALEIGHRTLTNRVNTSFTLVGSEADLTQGLKLYKVEGDKAG